MADREGNDSLSRTRKQSISRRQFAAGAALVSAAAAYLPATALAIEEKGPALPQQPSPATPRLSAEAQAEADTRYQAILARRGSRLSEAQKEDLRRLTGELQKALEALRKAELENGDAPALYLKPLVERENKPGRKGSAAAKKS